MPGKVIDPPEKGASGIVKSLTKLRRERSVGIANHMVALGFRLFPVVVDLALGGH